MELITTFMTGLVFPLIILYVQQWSKNKELEKKLEEQSKEDVELLKKGMCVLLKNSIIDYHKRYMHEGCIPLYALENAKKMYETYSQFGVNGVKDMMEELGNLPIRN